MGKFEIFIIEIDVNFDVEWSFKEYPIVSDYISIHALTEKEQQTLRQVPLPQKMEKWSHIYKNMYDLISDVGLTVESRSWSKDGLIVYCECSR